MNGSVWCSITATSLDKSLAQADWLGPKVGSQLAVIAAFSQMNRVNSRNGCAMMIAP